MSKCVECAAEMDACEASQFLECPLCRTGAKKRGHRVKTIYDKGSEQAGRKTRGDRKSVV